MAIIGPIDEVNATKELLTAKENTLVYHTSHTDVVLKLRSRIGLRRSFYEHFTKYGNAPAELIAGMFL